MFRDDADYAAFLTILLEAQKAAPMRLLDYTLMSDHWHLVLRPDDDEDLPRFMHRLATTHANRRPLAAGAGARRVYQGRFKSFPVQDDHYLAVCRYVSRNPVRAGLVTRAQDWPWSSLYQRIHAKYRGWPDLSHGPVARPGNWLAIVNEPQSPDDEEAIRLCIARGRPFGDEDWVANASRRFHLESTLRPVGRPFKRR